MSDTDPTSQHPGPPALRAARPGLADRLRLDWYLIRLDWHLQDYPQKAARAIKREIKADLLTAAAETGMPAALAALGSPAVLAHGYLTELGRPRPRFTAGAIAAALVVGALWYMQIAYAIGALDTLEAVGGGAATLTVLGSAMTYTHTAAEISVEGAFSWQWLAVWIGAGVLAFLPGSRIWRLWRPAR